jgi:hypothetical protein
LVYFIPHLWIIPVVGIVNEEHKKPHIYRHGTKQYSEDSFPANRLIDMSTEPAITFGDTMLTLLTQLWNIRATFPKDRIILYGDNLGSCFCQRQLAPAFAAANTSMYKQHLIISTGNHFSGRWAPANNEALARARSTLCKWMYENSSYQLELNQDEIDRNCKLVFTSPPKTLAVAHADTKEQLQYDSTGQNFKVKHVMYIDDSQTAQIQSNLNKLGLLIASSLKSVYILLGYPGQSKSHTTLLPSRLTKSWKP